VKEVKEEPSHEMSQPRGFLRFRRPKNESAVKVKKEEPPSPPPVKKEKRWWEEKLDLAATSRHSDDLEDASGQRLQEAHTFHKVQPMDDATACLMSAINAGNIIALDSDEEQGPTRRSRFRFY
jgi:hypothetical protein